MAGESLKSLRSDCTEIILPTEGCALDSLLSPCCANPWERLLDWDAGVHVTLQGQEELFRCCWAQYLSVHPHPPSSPTWHGTDVLLSTHPAHWRARQALHAAAAGVHSPAPNCYTPAIPVSSGLSKARLFLWPKLELWARAAAGAGS